MESKTNSNMKNKNLKIAWFGPPANRIYYEYSLAWMYTKTYVDLKSPYKDCIEWIEPIYNWRDLVSVEEAISYFKNADVILFSSYIWNYSINIEAAQYVKKNYPNILTILGGPQSEWNHPDFIQRYDMFDYHCEPVSPAEVYMFDWITSWFEDGIPVHSKIAYDKRSTLKKPFEYPEKSIYVYNKEFIEKAKSYFDSVGVTPRIGFETTRGCPFKCTFCEWGGGTGSKMKKKPMDIIIQDLDCLSQLGFKEVDIIDSNLGAFKDRDWEILQLIKDRGLDIMVISMLKTKDLNRKKEIVDKLMDNGHAANLSVQTFSQTALSNAQRPDLNLEQQFELVEYIRDRIVKEHGEDFFDKSAKEIAEIASVEFIMGMPGSTKEDFYQEYSMMELLGSWVDGRFDYNYLPNTIASTQDDLVKFGVELSPVYTMSIFGTKNHFCTISNCSSYTKEDMYEMFFMNLAGNYLRKNIYDLVKNHVNIVDFLKDCYQALSKCEDFNYVQQQIIEYFDKDKPSDFFNFVNLDGNIVNRSQLINTFIERNRQLLIAQLMNQYILRECA
jgi:radical SAM superfamily enzyme YgiQ (UPF0313 family)